MIKPNRTVIASFFAGAAILGLGVIVWQDIQGHYPVSAAPIAAAPPLTVGGGNTPDNLNHDIVVWTITTTKQVSEQEVDDVYHPGKKVKQAVKPHPETTRIVAAKEFKTKQEADKFIADSPMDVRPHMTLVDEDK